MIDFEIYGKNNCSFCDKAKKVLTERNISFKYYELATDISIDNFKEKFPEQKTVPVVVVHGWKIGGYSELLEYLEETSGGFGDG